MNLFRENREVYFALLGGTFITALFFAYVESKVIHDEEVKFFEEISSIREHVFLKNLKGREIAETIESVFKASDYVEADEFQVVAKKQLLNYPFIHSVAYIPHILKSDVRSFEKEMQNSGFVTYTIRPDNEALGNKCFPVKYIEPLTPRNSMLLGLNLASTGQYSQAIDQAINTGTITASPLEKMKGGGKFSFLLIKPLFPDSSINRNDPMNLELTNALIAVRIDASLLINELTTPANIKVRWELTSNFQHGDSDNNKLYIQNTPHADEGFLLHTFRDKAPLNYGNVKSSLSFEKQLYWQDINKRYLFTPLLLGIIITVLLVILARSIQLKNVVLLERNKEVEKQVKDKTKDLQESETRFSLAMQGANDGLWDWDLLADKIYYSPRWKNMLGYKEDELGSTLKTWEELIHPDEKEWVREKIYDYLEGHTNLFEIEMRLRHKQGRWITVLSRASLVKRETDKKPVRLVGTHVDISDRKRTENLQKSVSNILEMIVENIPVSDVFKTIISTFESHYPGIRGSILMVENGRLCNGVAPNLPDEYNKAVNGLEIGPMVGSCGSAAFLGERVIVEDIATDPRWVSVKDLALSFNLRACWSEPIFNEEGDVSGTFAMYYDQPHSPDNNELNDISIAAKLAGIAIEREKNIDRLRKFSRAIEQAGESVVITDSNRTIEYVNPAFSTITGYAADEVIGKTPAILKSNAQDSSYYEALWETISHGRIWQGSVVDRKKDGSFYPAMMSIAPIFDKNGNITHYIATQQDMSKYKKLEEQFQQSQKMEAIGTLVGGIAHDFNNMLGGIIGNLYLAKRKVDDNVDVIEKLENVERLSNRAADMIKQLLTFARKDTVQMQPLELIAVFKDSLKLVRSGIPENIQLHESVSAQSIMLQGEYTQLQQLIVNLVNNARDAVSDISKPTIRCQLELFISDASFIEKHPHLKMGSFAHLTVSDNGYGIPKDKQDKIFDPFFTTKSVGKGTGLGLSTVFGTVERHNGVIELDSDQSLGATFHIYLPLAEEQVEIINEVETDSVQGQGETVLLVDDEDGIRNATSEVLRSLGYKVLEASDGAEAIGFFESNPDKIDLLITDLIMPKTGGLDLAKVIRKHNKAMPIIFITGYDKGQVMNDDFQFDNCLIISKPFSLNKLSQLIRSMLEGH